MDRSAAVNNGSSSSEASTSSRPGQKRDDVNDELDLLGDAGRDDILGDDPLHEDLREPISFKRKQKQTIFSHPGRFLSTLTGSRSDGGGAGGRAASPNLAVPLDTSIDGRRSPLRSAGAGGGGGGGGEGHVHPSQNAKNGVPLDWYAEGPGRRVGYEDLTAIDWIFEYTKERQRLRVLYSSASGVLGYFQQLLDASQVWVILVLTGLAVGIIAAGIDVTTDWLGDLKAGYCSSGPDGGAFYLNKGFCCLGYDQGAKCLGWKPWAAALGISSRAGKWIIEYFFFVMFSVRILGLLLPHPLFSKRKSRIKWCLFIFADAFPSRLLWPSVRASWSKSMQSTQSTAGSPRSRQFWVVSSLDAS